MLALTLARQHKCDEPGRNLPAHLRTGSPADASTMPSVVAHNSRVTASAHCRAASPRRKPRSDHFAFRPEKPPQGQLYLKHWLCGRELARREGRRMPHRQTDTRQAMAGNSSRPYALRAPFILRSPAKLWPSSTIHGAVGRTCSPGVAPRRHGDRHRAAAFPAHRRRVPAA